ncbi:acetylcholine receptor subunit delta-like [Apostichopus japonicus]|uniref:acetylcholine receptor subunit delta-like n=1 Tax=Stichopus japonicus TaxID=307972 RepID=UPI003AB63C91
MNIMIITRFLCLLVILSDYAVSGRYSKHAEARVREYILGHENYTAGDYPVFDSDDVVDLSISLQFYAMLDLHERDQTITTASWMTIKWTDPRLTWDPSEFDGVDLVVMYIDEIWTPRVFLANSFSSTTSVVSSKRGGILLTSDGVAVLGAPLVVTTQCPLYIQYFPFDTQACVFMFAPENQVMEHVNLHSVQSVNPSMIESSEWDLIAVKNSSFGMPFVGYLPNRPASTFPVTLICMYLRRNPAYYITNLIVPSTILNLMAILTFITPPDSGERISLGVSLVLGLTVFQILVADSLPTASKEFPVLNNYLTINFILACLAVPFSLLSINLVSRENRPAIIRRGKMRELFLEILPRVFCVRSYSQRLRGGLEEIITPVRKWSDDNGSTLTITTVLSASRSSKNKVLPLPEAPPPVMTPLEEEHETLSNTEKIKLECRTLSVVLDRMGMSVIFTTFIVLVIVTVICFQGVQQGVVKGECAQQGLYI